MKKLFLVAAVIALTSVFSNAHGQEKNYVISTGNPHYIPAIIGTANEMAKKNEANLGEIQIVLYGKAVADLDNAKKTAPWLDKIDHEAINLTACNIALGKFDVDKQQVPKQFDVVADAFVYLLELKEKGYYALDL